MNNTGRRCTGYSGHGGECSYSERELGVWLDMICSVYQYYNTDVPDRCSKRVGRSAMDNHPFGDGSGR